MVRRPINLSEYETLAKERLPQVNYYRIAGGATDEITLRRNQAAFSSIMLCPRTLVDVSQVSLSTSVLGQNIKYPIMLAPASSHNLAHFDAEIATAHAAASEETVVVVSSASSHTMEKIGRATSGLKWAQQYLYRDKGLTMEMAHRAKDAKYSAICLTVDSKVNPKRERDIRLRTKTSVPPNYVGLHLDGYFSDSSRYSPIGLHFLRDKSGSWDYLDWFLANTPLPVVVKGIMTAEEGRLCAEHGVRALVVSNHGGGLLDGTHSTIEVLPEVAEAVYGTTEVYVDGGIRRGTDVFKALALGARAVMIGRPLFWGLAVAGEGGVRGVLQILRDELEMTMKMCGYSTLDSIGGSVLRTMSPLLEVLSGSGQPRFSSC